VTPNGLVWSTRNHLWSTIGFQILRTTFVILISGRDSNHLIYNTAPKDLNWILVGPEFHALHHVYPGRYIGSFIKVFDWIWGTAYSFRRKRFTIIGGSEAFSQAIIAELEREEGVACIRKLRFGTYWDHGHFGKGEPNSFKL
jgi:sterol desaturase/sphingolipid hydroxylase (fatty acid hydroxylase superfamily)